MDSLAETSGPSTSSPVPGGHDENHDRENGYGGVRRSRGGGGHSGTQPPRRQPYSPNPNNPNKRGQTPNAVNNNKRARENQNNHNSKQGPGDKAMGGYKARP